MNPLPTFEEFLTSVEHGEIMLLPKNVIERLRYVLGRYHYTKEQQDRWLKAFYTVWMAKVMKKSQDALPEDVYVKLEDGYTNNKYEGVNEAIKTINQSDPKALQAFHNIVLTEFTSTLNHFIEETTR